MKSDKNQLEFGKEVSFRPKMYLFHLVVQYENYLICIFRNINENLKIRTKPLQKTSISWGNRPTLNH